MAEQTEPVAPVGAKVFVVWDPLYECVCCVHLSEDTWCDKCKEVQARAEKDRAYFPEGKWFEIQG